MKNKIISLILILIMVSICGCSSTETYPITDEESDAIAQYCAYLLLKHDKNETVSEKLMDWKDLNKLKDKDKEKKEEDSSLKPVEKSEATPTPTPVPKAEDKTADSSDKLSSGAKSDKSGKTDEKKEEKKDTSSDSKASDGMNIPKASGKYVSSMDEVFSGSESQSFAIKYDTYGICKRYDENDYFSISAPKNKNILFVEFDIRNNSDKNIHFDAGDYNVEYCLYDNKGNSIEPELTALHNDLLYLDETLTKKSEYSSVLLFYVDEKATDFVLRSEDSLNGKVYDIKIN